VTTNSNTGGTLVALAAAVLGSSVMLAPVSALAGNVTAPPAEFASVSKDALIRVAQYGAVRRQYVIRPLKKPRYLPPNPCRIKSNTKRC
jgi:hypothetical protein